MIKLRVEESPERYEIVCLELYIVAITYGTLVLCSPNGKLMYGVLKPGC